MKYAVAIDIGGTNTRVALINERYEITYRIQFRTDTEDPEVTLGEIAKGVGKANWNTRLSSFSKKLPPF